MKTCLGMIGFLIGSVILAGILAQPYFRPEKAWPDWLILVVGLAFVIACMIFWPRHKSPKQIIDEYEELVWQEKDADRTLARARKEQWKPETLKRLESELEVARGKLAALRNDQSR